VANKKFKSIGVATLKSLGAQYSSFVGIVEQVSLLHSDFESELNQVLNLWHEKTTKKNNPEDCHILPNTNPVLSLQAEACKNSDNKTQQTSDIISESPELNVSPWLKKLFKKIAMHCHPDKVLATSFSVTEKHKRMSSYDKARSALDESDEPMMISIGLLYDEVPDIGIVKSKKILMAGVTGLQSCLDNKQKSVVWTWGMSEDNLQVKSKILVHATTLLYNKNITEAEALRVVKEYFEIRDLGVARKVGTHPGPSLNTTRRNKKS
jgi:hypothetical protein